MCRGEQTCMFCDLLLFTLPLVGKLCREGEIKRNSLSSMYVCVCVCVLISRMIQWLLAGCLLLVHWLLTGYCWLFTDWLLVDPWLFTGYLMAVYWLFDVFSLVGCLFVSWLSTGCLLIVY